MLAVALAACFVFGWAFVAATTALTAWVSNLVPERAAADTSVLFTLTMDQAVGSSLASNLADHGRLPWPGAAAIAAVGAACGAAGGRPWRKRADSVTPTYTA